MRNIFIIYMAPGNYEQMVHYQDTIKNKVPQERVLPYLDVHHKNRVREIFSGKPIAIWGSRDTKNNRVHFEKMQPGDDILIVEGQTIKLLGKAAIKTIDPALSQELWKRLQGKSHEDWSLIYFIANPLEINLPFKEFKKLFGYSPDWSLRGFMSIRDEKVQDFYEQFDDLYSVLTRLKKKEKIETKRGIAKEPEEKYQPVKEDEELIPVSELSDHVKMQWMLLRLGLKTGSRVWVPRADQPKIQREFGYSDFETEFATGIDVPARFVENIDVVWKEEFRIDAAFEIENTTAIYSGLLRFSDLKIVAPNSNYPLFIVAPLSKKGRVIEQVRRPTFKRLEFDSKVRYLSYEAVKDVDKFFESSGSGLSVDLLVGKSEEVA
jgi:hypothetical protein